MCEIVRSTRGYTPPPKMGAGFVRDRKTLSPFQTENTRPADKQKTHVRQSRAERVLCFGMGSEMLIASGENLFQSPHSSVRCLNKN